MAKGFGRKGPLPFRHVFIITFIIFILSTAQALWIINKGIKPTLMEIAEEETKVLATQAINYAISKRDNEDINQEDLYSIQTDEGGKISTIGYNRDVVTELLSKTTNRVQTYLKRIAEGETPEIGMPPDVTIEVDEEKRKQGIFTEIPLGQATNNVLLANLGPKVPVRFMAIGSVRSDVKEEITPYGINNTMIKLYIHITVNVRVVIPFATETAEISQNIPVDTRVIQGEVPYFYNGDGGDGANPSFEVPAN